MKVFSCVACLIFGYSIQAQDAFAFGRQNVLPGTRQHFTIPISDGEQETTVPITVFHGAQNGLVLGITAGVHGYEYAPILAGQQLIERINPRTLSGTVILVHIANVESFLGRSPFVNPVDHKNLNRVFPGKAEGTLTERVAHYISQKLIPRCDYFLDMHSGDAPEDLMPYIAYYQHDAKTAISEKGREAVLHMGFDHIVVFRTTEKEYMQAGYPSLYCSAEAFKQGIPSIDIECGKLGIVEADLVEKITDGVIGLLQHLKMAKGTPEKTKSPLYLENRSYTSSGHQGFFYPYKSSGDYVAKGMKIGRITNFFSETIAEIQAPQNGIILYMLGTPPVNKGETVVVIGKVKEEN